LLVLWGIMVSTKRSWDAGGGARRTDGSLLFLKARQSGSARQLSIESQVDLPW
jgi:hypothetical protein